MNWFQKLFMSKKGGFNKNPPVNRPSIIDSFCFVCNTKGYRTTVTKNSYACKKCGAWWAP